MASPPGTPTTEFHPPRLISSLVPSLSGPSNLLAAVPGAAHATVFPLPALDDGPSFPGSYELGALPVGSVGRASSWSRSRDGWDRDAPRHRGSIRRRRSGRSVALVAASLAEGEVGVDEEVLAEERRRVLKDIRELFAGRPTPEIWQRSFRPDSVYEDPLAKAVGIRQVAAQFYLLPLLVPPQTLRSHLLASTPTQLVLSLVQEYHLRATSLKKVVKSVLVVDLDVQDRVKTLWDLWEGEDVPVRWGAGVSAILSAWKEWLAKRRLRLKMGIGILQPELEKMPPA